MKAFRCPFELKGEEKGLILSLELSLDRAQNIVLVAEAFKAFHMRPELIALRCRLPKALGEIASFEDLKVQLLPFQADLLAGEMEWRFYPFLLHQIRAASKEDASTARRSEYFPLTYARALMEEINKVEGALPESGLELALWLEKMLRKAMAEIPNMPVYRIFEHETGEPIHAISFSPAGLICVIDRAYHLRNKKKSRNCFNIVKAPLYPQEFGRWSERVEIVFSREGDIDSLSSETRKKIRAQANRVHKKHGVPIASITKDKQPTGLWIPETSAAAE